MGFNDTAYYTWQLGKKGFLLVDDTVVHPRENGYSGFKVLAATVVASITLEDVATSDAEDGTVAADVISAVTASAVGDVIMVEFTDIQLTSGNLLCYKR